MAPVGELEVHEAPVTEPEEPTTAIGWLRATVSALLIVIVGTVLFVLAPNWLLNHLTGISRNGRVAVVTTSFVVFFVGFTWGLRRLQSRGAI